MAHRNKLIIKGVIWIMTLICHSNYASSTEYLDDHSEALAKCNKLSKNATVKAVTLDDGKTVVRCEFAPQKPEVAPPEPSANALVLKAANECAKDVGPAVQACALAQANATKKCDPEKDPNMNSFGNAAKQIALNSSPLASMAGQSGSLRGSCVMIQAMSGMANAAVMMFSDTCGNERKDCTNACANANTAVDECVKAKIAMDLEKLTPYEKPLVTQIKAIIGYDWIANGYEVCAQLISKQNEAGQASQNIMQALQGGMSCQGKTTGTIKGVNPVVAATGELCKMDPTLPGCTAGGAPDCSNSTVAATNPVCQCITGSRNCSVGTTPGDLGGLNGGGGGTASKIGAGPLPDLSGLLGDGSNPMAMQPPSGDRGGGDVVGGRVGNGANLGGDGGRGGGAPPDSGGGGGAPGDPLQVNSGYWSGGAGGSGGGRSGLGGPGGNGNGNGNGRNGATDLRKFLPGGKFDPSRRVLAGSNGSDPIHGPHVNIWEKMHIRYRSVQPTLLKNR